VNGSPRCERVVKHGRPSNEEKVDIIHLLPKHGTSRAGWRKKPTPLSQLKAAWKKTSQEERKAFLAVVGGSGCDVSRWTGSRIRNRCRKIAIYPQHARRCCTSGRHFEDLFLSASSQRV
jgi:hypothetical protein